MLNLTHIQTKEIYTSYKIAMETSWMVRFDTELFWNSASSNERVLHMGLFVCLC